MCWEQYNIYKDAWKQKTLCSGTKTVTVALILYYLCMIKSYGHANSKILWFSLKFKVPRHPSLSISYIDLINFDVLMKFPSLSRIRMWYTNIKIYICFLHSLWRKYLPAWLKILFHIVMWPTLAINESLKNNFKMHSLF